eukprot:TRINITY_DN13047_c0_g1_i1.p1 TRINITY_DN13047_c0_g1~~TRINITY_DN13047_c0_g1_i1.p1  ORF type:complete len:215 (-),score=32.80 TRINITY_DN13047_c0_g1_i1:14-658(-)
MNEPLFYRPTPIEPPSKFCRAYQEESCCSYIQTFQNHLFLLENVLFSEGGDIHVSPKCYEALESFVCYPCASNSGIFFYSDDKRGMMVWNICPSTCEYLYTNCNDDLGNDRMANASQFCQLLERVAEGEAPYEDLDVILMDHDDKQCFEALEPNRGDGLSGCGISWLVFVGIILVCCCSAISVVAYGNYKRRQNNQESYNFSSGSGSLSGVPEM